MSEQIIVPALGESVTEATVSKWLKSEGDSVQSDEAVVELETDKVNIEVPSPSSGTLEKISVKEGQTVNVGSLLGSINKSQKSANDKNQEINYDKTQATLAEVINSLPISFALWNSRDKLEMCNNKFREFTLKSSTLLITAILAFETELVL